MRIPETIRMRILQGFGGNPPTVDGWGRECGARGNGGKRYDKKEGGKKFFKKGLAIDQDFVIIQFIAATLRRTKTRLTEPPRNTLCDASKILKKILDKAEPTGRMTFALSNSDAEA